MLTLVMGVAATVFAGQSPRRLDDKDLEALLERIDEGAQQLEASLERDLDRSPLDDTAEEEEIARYVEDFQRATKALQEHCDEGDRATALVGDVLTRGTMIDRFVATRPVGPLATGDWHTLRARLAELASAYGQAWHWQFGRFPRGAPARRLTDEELGALIERIEERTDRFEHGLEQDLARWNPDDRRTREHATSLIEGLEQATDRLRNRYDDDDQAADVVSQVLWQARRIDDLMERSRFGPRSETEWAGLRSDLGTLAGTYGVEMPWISGPAVGRQP